MIKYWVRSTATFGAVLLLGSAFPAQAAGNAAIAWVSGQGADSASCGSTTAPCRTFQYAHDNILGSGGGDIAVRDPGVYGQLTITKPLAIINDGVGAAGMGAPAGGTAITINAGPNDTILLRGLTLDGGGTATTGIAFNNGGRIDIQKSVIRNFAQFGIYLVAPQFTYSISDSTVTETKGAGNFGILIYATSNPTQTRGVISNVNVSHNEGGGIAVSAADGAIVDSLVSNNGGWGIQTSCTSSLNNISITNSTVNYNKVGINAHCATTLAKTTVQKNDIGVSIGGAPASGTVYSYGDNNIDFNSILNLGGSLTPVAKQ